MALRSDRHRIRPIAALALDAGTTIGPRWATIHDGQEPSMLHTQAGYTTAADSKGSDARLTRLKTGKSPYRAAIAMRNIFDLSFIALTPA
jgi:hypothetical protein